MHYRHSFWRIVVFTAIVALALGIVVVRILATQDRQASTLYIMAVASSSVDSDSNRPPIDVDVWINGRLEAHRVSGDRIPLILLKPGHYTLKVTAPGRIPYVERIDAGPPHSGETYVYATLVPTQSQEGR